MQVQEGLCFTQPKPEDYPPEPSAPPPQRPDFKERWAASNSTDIRPGVTKIDASGNIVVPSVNAMADPGTRMDDPQALPMMDMQEVESNIMQEDLTVLPVIKNQCPSIFAPGPTGAPAPAPAVEPSEASVPAVEPKPMESPAPAPKPADAPKPAVPPDVSTEPEPVAPVPPTEPPKPTVKPYSPISKPGAAETPKPAAKPTKAHKPRDKKGSDRRTQSKRKLAKRKASWAKLG